MRSVIAAAAALLMLVLQGNFTGARADTGYGIHCTGMTVTDGFISYADDQTASTDWVNVTDAHVNFRTSSTGCVIITFSGNAVVIPNGGYDSLRVRTLLDGNQLCAPGQLDDTFLDAVNPAPHSVHSITRLCRNVLAGVHNVQVQYENFNGSGEISGHVLTVTHN